MRASRSPRRSLPGFAVDMALRDMRRKPDPLVDEMLQVLKAIQEHSRTVRERSYDQNVAQGADLSRQISAVIAKAEGRING